ncbi:hypothetical protein EW146_g129 [Bondarzewia mesenterica]|uniref:UV-damage endonuclease n=1 Tax=Bondarzewia mesenterica TaxID=1095465 RepID=A0A4S4M9S7_9AGAM|nr:hypothetical protein EW146_g129 [Bondarzewia mesenterica]
MVAKRARKIHSVSSDAAVTAPRSSALVQEESVALRSTRGVELEVGLQRRASTRIRSKIEAAEAAAAAAVDSGLETPLTEPDEAVSPPKKRRRKTKKSEPVVYDIPTYEPKTTTYKGRLGYACLNTILREIKPNPIFCSRTCRIDTILKNGLDFAKDLGVQNVKDLKKLIQWNEENKIRFMRISSELFPFASHAKYGYSLDYAAAELKAAGDLANSLGHRLTLHPGQFTQLASTKEDVVTASVRELKYHCSILRHMGMGEDSVIIIHMGGMYGDKTAALKRFKENYRTKITDEVRARLVLENDEMCYNADDLLPVCEELNIPIVFDHHHNWIFPSTQPIPELLSRINAIWHHKGIRPKQHLSSPRPGAVTLMERRAHAGRCKDLPDELQLEGVGWRWLPSANANGTRNEDDKEWFDLMIEAKDKEQAVFQLYRTYGLEEVIWENLRPEKVDAPIREEKETKGSRITRSKQKGEDIETVVTTELPDEDPATAVETIDPQPSTTEGSKATSTRKNRKKMANGKHRAAEPRLIVEDDDEVLQKVTAESLDNIEIKRDRKGKKKFLDTAALQV